MQNPIFSRLSRIEEMSAKRVGLVHIERKIIPAKQLAICSLCLLLCLTSVSQGAFTPWDALQDDLWLADPNVGSSRLDMNTVNNGSSPVGFDYVKQNGGAKGMSSLRFTVGGTSTGHISSSDLVGGFDVICGGTKVYSDLLVLVAIDSPDLPADFSMSLGLTGQAQYNFDNANDFSFYDPIALGYDAGRPSGYYSGANPTGSPLAYDFDSGMLSIYAFSDLSFGSATTMNVEYAFENLPGKAVFSLYALVDGKDFIYHTNRGLADANDPTAKVSTFEVVPEPAGISLMILAATGILRRRK